MYPFIMQVDGTWCIVCGDSRNIVRGTCNSRKTALLISGGRLSCTDTHGMQPITRAYYDYGLLFPTIMADAGTN